MIGSNEAICAQPAPRAQPPGAGALAEAVAHPPSGKVLADFQENAGDDAADDSGRPARDGGGMPGMGLGYPVVCGHGWWHAGMVGLPGQQGPAWEGPGGRPRGSSASPPPG